MIEREGNRLVVRGRLDIATVPALFEAGLQYLASEDLLVDMSAVEGVDSAAVSLLLGWARAAQRSRRKLHVSDLPADLLSLARLYGVEELLPPRAT